MDKEKIINKICAIKRGLGIIEGVASNMTNDDAKDMLYRAAVMIDEAVYEVINDGK